MQCPTIKSLSLSFCIGFFFKYIKYFVIEKNEKTHFLMNFQPKNLNFQMALIPFNVYQ
jgi:hypothetical protein